MRACLPSEVKMAHLTKRAVDAVEASEKDVHVWDDEIGGFGMKVTPKGRKVFIYQYRFPAGRRGRTRRCTIGRLGDVTPDHARKRARVLAAAVADGRGPYEEELEHRQSAAAEMTMTKLARSWLNGFRAQVRAGERSARTLADYESIAERVLLPLIGRRRAKSLTRQDVQQLKATLTERHGTASANLALRALSTLLSHGVEIAQLATNSATGQGQFTTKKRERFLSEVELARLGDALRRAEAEGLPPAPQERGNSCSPRTALVPTSPVAIAAIRLLLFSGMRKGEVLGLKWAEIDSQRREIVLTEHKTSRKTGVKRVPLTPEVESVLETAKRWRTSVFVFPGKKPGTAFVGISKVWDRIRCAANLRDVRLHDLRHTYASLAVSQGMSLPLVGSLLGHADAATTSRYAHLHDDPRRQAAEAVSSQIQSALKREDVEPLVVELPKR
jgi:integrase